MLTSASESGHHRADWHARYFRDFFVGETLHFAQHNHRSEVGWQSLNGPRVPPQSWAFLSNTTDGIGATSSTSRQVSPIEAKFRAADWRAKYFKQNIADDFQQPGLPRLSIKPLLHEPPGQVVSFTHQRQHLTFETGAESFIIHGRFPLDIVHVFYRFAADLIPAGVTKRGRGGTSDNTCLVENSQRRLIIPSRLLE